MCWPYSTIYQKLPYKAVSNNEGVKEVSNIEAKTRERLTSADPDSGPEDASSVLLQPKVLNGETPKGGLD